MRIVVTWSLLLFTFGTAFHAVCSLSVNEIKSVTHDKEPSETTQVVTPSTTTGSPKSPNKKLNTRVFSARHRLRNVLLEKYDKEVHPVSNHSDTVVVSVGMSLIHLDINELKSTMDVDAWMRFTWIDEYLSWDPSDYENLTKIHFSEDEIWQPDILPYNNANPESLNPYHKTSFLVHHTGDVLWVPPVHLKAFCRLDLKMWPLDTQTCSLKFGSWTSHANQIDLALFKNATVVEKIDFYTKDREWVVLNTTVVKNSVSYVEHPDIYADITFSFNMKRISQSYKYVIILPCLVTMLMSTCSFGLPSNSHEKLFLNGIAFIVCVLYLVYFATILPFQSSTVPILVKFYSNTVVLIGAAIVINVIVLNMTQVRKHVYPPKFLRIIFAGPLGKCLCLDHYRHQISSTHTRLQVNNELIDMAESEQPPDLSQRRTISSNDGLTRINSMEEDENDYIFSGNDIMGEWILVAAGIEKICLFTYALSFSIVTYSYS
ncbi:neuronal acetylcholine receptor subunit alpha-4 [Lepeophtheirus salmonis]|uniref:neuronal acetylcholine receptor subunit alpha-4 n=1 Tax=Lepeophtheirus salmonis TaxID=72036 RepID=UPI001AE86F4B|nr:neuronal acetylcholine receptor subunit alpha-5-like [Lepeophtheirus salmonis]